MYKILFLILFYSNICKSEDQPFVHFSRYQSTYFVFGKNDLKIQFSFKYRLAESIPLYLGYTQIMFWSIYNGSKPFSDINYDPEVFYRLKLSSHLIKTLDFGYLHISNGMKDSKSRSLDRLNLRTNSIFSYNRHQVDITTMFYQIYNTDQTNRDIIKHMGYWELRALITNIIIHEKESLDIEGRFFSGKRIINLSQGGYQLGLIYNLGTLYLNPSIYIQYYNGFSEKLLDYESNHSELRAGFLLSF